MQLQVALWTFKFYMFLWLGLNKVWFLHTLPLQSRHPQTLRLVSLVRLIIIDYKTAYSSVPQ